MSAPRILVAGTHSGVGKTTVTLALLAAFARRGCKVQGFKVGPDYIDPTYHAALTGRPSRNLDTWMLGHRRTQEVFARATKDADLAVVEGVMGLFDGKDPLSNTGSSAEVATVIQAPVLLVVDAAGMARSTAAVVRGYQLFDPAVRIAGVIVNRVGGEGHYRLVQAAVERECGVPTLGYLAASSQNLHLPERHLGLVPALERTGMAQLGDRLAHAAEATLRLDEILDLARSAAPLAEPDPDMFALNRVPARTCIAVARDAAFHFYYPENLELLEHFGARLMFFSPLAGQPLPSEAAGLYIGGGFPEEFAARLATPSQTKADILRHVHLGLPTYAECGGYMYLAQTLTDTEGRTHPMVGAIPGHVVMQNRLAGFGYREVVPESDNWLLAADETVRGHEFHYSRMQLLGNEVAAYRVSGPQGEVREGFAAGNLIAGYTHLHFGSRPQVAQRFVAACQRAHREGGAQRTST